MRKVLFALCAALMACQGPEANDVAVIKQGLLSYSTPYGGSYNKVGIGRVSWTGYNLVIWWRNSDSNCTIQALASPLWDDVQIDNSYAIGSEIQIVGPGQSTSFYCANLGASYTMNVPFNQGGHKLTVYGSSPYADYINCSGDDSGPISCFGQGGNDTIDTSGHKTELWGGDGDDKLRIIVAGQVTNKLFGGNGNDCLQWSGYGNLGAYQCDAHPAGNCPDPVGHPEACDRSTYILGTGCQWQVPNCN